MSTSKDKLGLNGISRRTFFKGGAATLTGIAIANTIPMASAATADPKGAVSKPVNIPANQIKETVTSDVVIIGDGLTGLCAAIAARDAGASVTIIEKNKRAAARGMHITGFDTKYQREHNITADYRQIIRELIRWAQGRVKEDLLWMFAEKCGDSFNWFGEMLEEKGLKIGIWDEYYKGPDYTEYPVTHIVYDPKTNKKGNLIFIDVLEKIAKDKGVNIVYQTPAVQILRKDGGAVTGVIAGAAGNYKQFNATKGVIIASGDYASNNEMKARYSPIATMVDDQIYFPNKCNTGEVLTMAMQAGGAMQKVEPHAAVIHLESGAMSYGFLHVNAMGKRFKNEDVNTQSKSCSKLFEPGGVAWTVYDADGLEQVRDQIKNNESGGLFYGQMDKVIGEEWDMEEERKLLEQHLKVGKAVQADTIEELAKKMGMPVDTFKATVERYNELAKQENDMDFGKRPVLLKPIAKPPFYAGKLLATLLTMCGGLRTDTSLHVLDENDKPIEGLFVAGAAQGDFFAADYPTICPGIGHGRCITFGRLAGLIAAGKSADDVPSLKV